MTFRPSIRTQSDLEHVWRTLMGPLGFSRQSIWVMLICADDRPFPRLTEVEQADAPPTATEEMAGFADVIGELAGEFAPGGRIAFLRSRPGAGGLTAEDRGWARALYDVARLTGVPVEVVHRACDVDLVPVPMDDALPASA